MDDNQVSVGNENGYDHEYQREKELDMSVECTLEEAVYYLKLITYSKDLGGAVCC